ncbi:PLP-dependent aminotransferase family protein [Dehalococcoidia bacterium]|nr:PLP-dependent aminotransferase family protein [Dehalococcoidia bacterium]
MNYKLPELLLDIEDGVIDLGWGHPSSSLYPSGDVREATGIVLPGHSATAFHYGAAQGFGPFLQSLSRFLSEIETYGGDFDARNFFLTAGASQGFDMACTLFSETGDCVFVEEPTYFVIESIFKERGLEVIGVKTDTNGICLQDLEDKLKKGLRPKFLYTIPTYQNPTGISIPTESRAELVRLAERYDFLILADEVYQLLNFHDLPPEPMMHFDNGNRVISFGSFSKILAPGMRTGWVHSSIETIEKFSGSAYAFSGGGLNHFSSVIIDEMLRNGAIAKNLCDLRTTLRNRSDLMNDALRKYFGSEIEFRKPEGGYYYWIKFKDSIKTEELLPIARKYGVSYRPGNAFSESGNFDQYLRLTYTLYHDNELVEGVERLSNSYREYLR